MQNLFINNSLSLNSVFDDINSRDYSAMKQKQITRLKRDIKETRQAYNILSSIGGKTEILKGLNNSLNKKRIELNKLMGK